MVSGKRPQFNLMVDPYTEQMLARGVGGAPMTNVEALRAKKGFVKDDPKTLVDNLGNLFGLGDILKAGGYSSLPGGAFAPYQVPKSVQEATEQITDESTNIFQVPGEVVNGGSISKINEVISDVPKIQDSDSALAQNIPAEDEKTQREKTQKEAITSLAQLNQEVAEDEMGRKKPSGPVIEDAFSSAMQDYIEQARGAGPETKELSLDDYKKEFAEATGIDISGKVDKSSALMAFGLALMQNRAGKGFNVGRMLSSVGEAGEVALPALEKAKTQARNDMIAAGKFALESRAADRATDAANAEKLKQRTDYFIIPKGEGISGTIAGLEKGKLQSLNLEELDALRKNENFSKQFDILPGSMWSSVVAEAMKTPEGKKLYRETPTTMNLFGSGDEAASGIFDIRIYDADPNSNKGGKGIIADSGRDAYRGLASAFRDIQSAKQKFADGFDLAKGTNVARFTLDKVDSLAAAFGIGLSGANDTEKLKLFLTKLQAQNAKEILGEAGKTISDADRALVRSIVGDVTLFENEARLQEKLGQLYDDIIVKKERKIIEALRTLDYYNNTDIASRLDSGPLEEEDQAELEAYLKSPAFTNILPSSQEKK